MSLPLKGIRHQLPLVHVVRSEGRRQIEADQRSILEQEIAVMLEPDLLVGDQVRVGVRGIRNQHRRPGLELHVLHGLDLGRVARLLELGSLSGLCRRRIGGLIGRRHGQIDDVVLVGEADTSARSTRDQPSGTLMLEPNGDRYGTKTWLSGMSPGGFFSGAIAVSRARAWLAMMGA